MHPVAGRVGGGSSTGRRGQKGAGGRMPDAVTREGPRRRFLGGAGPYDCAQPRLAAASCCDCSFRRRTSSSICRRSASVIDSGCVILNFTGSSNSGACRSAPGAATPGGALTWGRPASPRRRPSRPRERGRWEGDDVQHRTAVVSFTRRLVRSLFGPGETFIPSRSPSRRGPRRSFASRGCRPSVLARSNEPCEVLTRVGCHHQRKWHLATDLHTPRPASSRPSSGGGSRCSVRNERTLPSNPSHGALRAPAGIPLQLSMLRGTTPLGQLVGTS